MKEIERERNGTEKKERERDSNSDLIGETQIL